MQDKDFCCKEQLEKQFMKYTSPGIDKSNVQRVIPTLTKWNVCFKVSWQISKNDL